jgi:hypothetical protein
MVVLAIDPGKTNGVALYDGSLYAWEIDFDTFGDWLEREVLKRYTLDRVVIERFFISMQTVKKSADAHWAMEIIGVTRFLARRYDVPFKLQAKSSVDAFASDEKLKLAGWYAPGRGHANDATRHLALSLAEDDRVMPPWLR